MSSGKKPSDHSHINLFTIIHYFSCGNFGNFDSMCLLQSKNHVNDKHKLNPTIVDSNKYGFLKI